MRKNWICTIKVVKLSWIKVAATRLISYKLITVENRKSNTIKTCLL